jgi:hypothetical protein
VSDVLNDLALAICARMESAGWTTRSSAQLPNASLGSFSRALNEGFVATAIVPWLELSAHEIGVVARVGLEHTSARDLLVRLAGSPVSGVLLREPTGFATFAREESVDRAADEIVEPYQEDPIKIVQEPGVDSVIDMLRSRAAVPFIEKAISGYAYAVAERDTEDPDSASGKWELISALLVAAGRYGDAKQVLDQRRPDEEDEHQGRRFTRQMWRVIESHGELPLPTTPAQWSVAHSEDVPGPETLRSRFTSAYAQASTKRSALDAVRAKAADRSREELRAMYERELTSRGVVLSPAKLEEDIDVLDTERQPLGTARLLVKVAKDIHGLIRSAELAASDRMGASWLRSPDRAAYPLVGSADEWTTAVLDPEIGHFLDRVWHASHVGFGNSRNVEVWLGRETTTGKPECLAVHIGDQRVGHIIDADSKRFAPVCAAAAERDEDPLTSARLFMAGTGESRGLDVPLPAASADTR